MIIKEFRVILPMTVEEYQVAQLWSVAQASKNETGGGEGIEVIQNEPFFDEMGKEDLLGGAYKEGQYTHKIYHLASKVPGFIRLLAPKGALEIVEKAWNAKVPYFIQWLAPNGALTIHEMAWNAYPYCKTVFSNPDYMKENFTLKIETMHLADRGNTENAHRLSREDLAKREVITIDIANDTIKSGDYKADEDPAKYKSEKTGRGPLLGDWKGTVTPVMCAYKLVTVEFKWWGLQKRVESFIQKERTQPIMCAYKLVTAEFKWFGLQNRVEKMIQKAERRIFTNFHRQVFCWTDHWYGLTMQDIRALEDRTKEELDQQRQTGEVRGTKATED